MALGGRTRSCSISRPPRIAEALRDGERARSTHGPTAYRLLPWRQRGRALGLAVDRFGDVAASFTPTARRRLDAHGAAGCCRSSSRFRRRRTSRFTPRQLHDRRRVCASRRARCGVMPVDELEAVRAWRAYAIQARGRPVRRALPGHARGALVAPRHARAAETVLNLFAYTCSLRRDATLGGAARVLNLDLVSALPGRGARRNYALNGLRCDPTDFVFGDAFDWLAPLRASRQTLRPGDRRSTRASAATHRRFRSNAITRGWWPRRRESSRRRVSCWRLPTTPRTSDARFDAWLRLGLKTSRSTCPPRASVARARG